MLRRTLVTLHMIAGLAAALFVVFGLTGSVMAFEEEIAAVVYQKCLTVIE